MVRTTNPLVERMTFFWHRHWANSRMDGLAAAAAGRTRTRCCASTPTSASKPSADFKTWRSTSRRPLDAALPDRRVERQGRRRTRTTGASSWSSSRSGVNDAGTPNYSENDVAQLAKSLTGWYIDDNDPNNASALLRRRAAGTTGRSRASASSATATPTDVVDLVLSQPNHPPYLVQKLWGEFIPTPPDAPTLQRPHVDLHDERLQIKPLLRNILTNPQLFDSIDEPNMIKTPVVFVVGVLRALGLGVTDSTVADYLDSMGQLPVLPAERLGLGGRPLVAQHEHGAGALRLRRRAHHVERLAGRSPTCSARRRRPPSTAPTARSARRGSPRGTRDQILDYADAHAIQDAQPATASPARSAAHAHARGSRRTGDVNDDQSEIQASNRASTATTATAVERRLHRSPIAAARFRQTRSRAGRRARAPRELTRRRLLPTASLGFASVYAATQLDWSRSASRRSPRRTRCRRASSSST